ncbi:unnamed protein product [Prorocentrum cordatum]|uniref:Uncharacterized protein n=1 Tax=Prorocentrum cordatum TaxID=2364126 RepID=A0ABN9WIV9_9DINO|nr:unnamed protein product [Polarella glacialis]
MAAKRPAAAEPILPVVGEFRQPGPRALERTVLRQTKRIRSLNIQVFWLKKRTKALKTAMLQMKRAAESVTTADDQRCAQMHIEINRAEDRHPPQVQTEDEPE